MKNGRSILDNSWVVFIIGIIGVFFTKMWDYTTNLAVEGIIAIGVAACLAVCVRYMLGKIQQCED